MKKLASKIMFVLICSLYIFSNLVQVVSAQIYNNLDTPFYDPGDLSSQCSSDNTAVDAPVDLGSNVKTAMAYFISQGLSDVQAAGIVGNLIAESGLIPNRSEHHGTLSSPINGDGFGIAQWTFTSRQQPLVDLAKQAGKPVTDLTVQLEYVMQEFNNGYKQVLGQLKGATQIITSKDPSLDTGSVVIVQGNTLLGGPFTGYEGPKDEAKSMPSRVAAAKTALADAGGNVTASDTSSSTCASSCSGGTSSPSNGKTVVLDPGHVPGSTPADERDPQTGLFVQDYDNPTNERADAYGASVAIGKILSADGYNVVNSKSSVDDKFNLSQRAAKDNAANGALVFVIHGNADGVRIAMYPDSQSTRTPKGSQRSDGTNGLVSPGIEALSQEYTQTIAGVISTKVSGYAAKSFYQQYGANGLGGNGLNNGNTPVQTILSKTPEVYSEVDNTLLSSDAFVKSAATGIEKALGGAGGNATPADNSSCSGAVSGNLIQTVLNYAWKDNRGDPYCQQTPAYQKAINAAHDQGQYTGAACNTDPSLLGDDCGAFVTRIMIDSGVDPGYNFGGKLSAGAGPTSTQKTYLDQQVTAGKYINLGAISDTTSLQPGDIAVNADHTFIYMGSTPGFQENSASASLGTRAPMARPAFFSNSSGTFFWYRLKG